LRLSEFFTAIDSIEVWISPTSTTNGTFGFDLQYQIRGYNDAFSESSFDFATVSDTVQLPNPHAAKIFERLVFTNFVSLNPGEFLVLLLIRDNTGEGDISESVYFREMCVYDR